MNRGVEVVKIVERRIDIVVQQKVSWSRSGENC